MPIFDQFLQMAFYPKQLTMKKLLFSFLLLSFAFSGQAQLVFKFGNISGDQGQTIDVPMRADGFTGIVSTQYSVHYDSAVLELVDVVNRVSGYDVEASDHRAPGTKTPKGQIGFLWFDPNTNPQTFAANTKMFDIRFKLIGKPCDSSLIVLANKPTSIEALDGNSNLVNITSQSGKVKINGTNCPGGGGGGNSGFNFIASQETVAQGANGCVKISVKEFRFIETMQATLKWNKTVARFTNVTGVNPALTGFSPNLGTNLSLSQDSTELGWLWSHPNGRTVTLPDDAILFQVCFDAVGANGSMTDMTFINAPTRVIEVTDSISGVIPVKLVTGKYTVVVPPSTLTLTIRDTTVKEGQEYCMPIVVRDFTCIEAFQFGLKFDNTKLRFKRVSGANIANVIPSQINVSNDTFRIVWDPNNNGPQTLSNGSTLFNICFDVIGKCTTTTKPLFVDLGTSSPIEFTAGCGRPPTPTVIKNEGTITIECASQAIAVEITSSAGVKCAGECTGTATANVSGGSGNYSFIWINDVTGQPVVPAITTKDPTNLCPGRYRLRVKDNVAPFDSATSTSITIADATPIVINFSTTHESMARNDGMIQANITGGCQPFRYRWTRLPNTLIDTTNSRINNLRCGNYTLSLTDCNGCVARDTTRVNCFTPPPTCTITVVDSIRCFGDCNGRIRVEVMDGAIPFTYRWSNDSTGINVSRLCTGTYTVTVTDGSNRTTTCTINLTQPSRINIVVNQITPSSGSNGGATTTIGGGTPGYTFSWTNSQGSVVGSSKDLSNVAPGDYRLLVTDSKGCTQTVDVTVPMISSGDTLRVSMAIDPRPGGGAISCRGACDGRIIATVSGSGAPFTYRWSHNANLNSNIANNLCPGTYRVTVTSSTGRTATAGPLTISDAPDINLNVRRISCASDNSTSNGRYEAVVSGGIAPYTYSWCSGAVAPTASDLAAGNCALTVTDNNGCTKSLSFTVCSESSADADCFKGILAISPNGDGANDNLVIQCVENFSNTLQIFNRWGQLVYQEVDYLNGWSGTDLDGTILTEGTYMWVLTVREPGKNDAIHKGTVTIVR